MMYGANERADKRANSKKGGLLRFRNQRESGQMDRKSIRKIKKWLDWLRRKRRVHSRIDINSMISKKASDHVKGKED